MKKLIIAIIILAYILTPLKAYPRQVGTWKSYLSYNNVTDVKKGGNILYVLASGALFTYNTTDESIVTYDKANGLNDNGIAYIAWCQSAHGLLIVYSNNNMDVLYDNGEIMNLPDYYNYQFTGDKTINDVYIDSKYAYLSTNFGILKIDVSDPKIKDTYNIGKPITHTYIKDKHIFAASSRLQATYTASLSSNLLDKNSWKQSGGYTPKANTTDPGLLSLANTLKPSGPRYNYFEFMKFHNGKLYTAGGGYTPEADSNRHGIIQVLKEDDNWQIYQDHLDTITGVNYISTNCLAIDPNDDKHVFGSGKTGIYEFYDGKFVRHFTYDNSPIAPAVTNNKGYVLVHGIIFDNDGNLWCFNSNNNEHKSILEYTKDKEWKEFPHTELEKDGWVIRFMKNPIMDSRGLVWLTTSHWAYPALICYNIKNNAIKVYDTFYNQDGSNITSNGVQCVTEDLDGNIWIGTNSNTIYLTSQDINDGNETFTQVKVPRNDGTNYADYLLSGMRINSIAIDGAGRKWFGTESNGAYLISRDNMKQLIHFTIENSSLLSNSIKSIAINDKTGEVFFGTEDGLCSYMSDATSPNTDMSEDNVYAYPNPVKPGFNGNITVVGLSDNADVKILTTNGSIVYEGKSNGGMFLWNGCDNKGKRVASGIYLVNTAKNDGSKGIVCKIAIIR